MRKRYICGNWKMHKGVADTTAWVEAFLKAWTPDASVEVGIAPPFTSLAAAHQAIGSQSLRLAAQNCHWETQGAFTGEISAAMLREAGCDSAIIGHSERRQYFGETDETVNRRTRAALAAGLTPIVCVGETLEERESGRTLEVVGRQVRQGLAGLSAEDLGRLVIAYEPVWAIGTGKVATSAQAQEVHAAIRGWLGELGGQEVAQTIRIQYGGSVKPSNAAELLAQPDIDGALVGGASLDPADFAQIAKAAVRS